MVKINPTKMYRFYSSNDKMGYIAGADDYLGITVKKGWKNGEAVIGDGTPARAVATLGADGVLCSDGITTERLPSTATTVVNTTGAGDAFLAGVAAALLRQVPFPATARFGLTAARAALLTAEAVNPQIATFFNQQ